MDILGPIAVVIFAWWISTGAILYLVGMPRMTYPLSMGVASVAAVMALFGLWAVADDTGVGAAYAGFLCGLIVWGWNEMSFLTGFITGPRTTACPKGASGWHRFSLATQTVIYHELAIAASVALATVLTWDSPNQVGALTLVILWVARLSAKLNVYLGVVNLTEEFLPDHLAHLTSYFRKRHMNFLLPLSITAATVATAMLGTAAVAPTATAFETASYALLAVLMALVVIEHWFLVLPISPAPMWSWGMASRMNDDDSEADARRNDEPGLPAEPRKPAAVAGLVTTRILTAP